MLRHFNICDYGERDKCYDSIKTYGPPCALFETDMSTLHLMWTMFRDHSYVRQEIHTRPKDKVSTKLRDVSLFSYMRWTPERAAL